MTGCILAFCGRPALTSHVDENRVAPPDGDSRKSLRGYQIIRSHAGAGIQPWHSARFRHVEQHAAGEDARSEGGNVGESQAGG